MNDWEIIYGISYRQLTNATLELKHGKRILGHGKEADREVDV